MGEGEVLTVPKPRAVGLLPVCPTVKPVGEPDALIGHVRFDERGWETERCQMAQATAPILDSTIAVTALCDCISGIGESRHTCVKALADARRDRKEPSPRALGC